MNIAVLSDIHGNITALRSVISDLKSLKITKIIFLGDLVINGPAPLECFQEIQDLKPICWVKGNTDIWYQEINEG